MSSGKPAMVRQSTDDLEEQYQNKLAEAAAIKAQMDEQGEKRASPEADAADTEEKAGEPAAKKQEEAGGDEDYSGAETEEDDMEDEEEERFEDGTTVAVAYGNLDGLSKRKWYAATITGYHPEEDTYEVTWKFPPRGKKKTFDAQASRCKPISAEDFEGAPKRGTGYVGLHRAQTFVAPSKEIATDEDSESEAEGPAVGDYVAVAYGNPRGNKRGTDPSAANPKKFKKRYLWYAATIKQNLGEDGFEVEWKHPTSMRAKTFVAPQDKVQPITAKEWKRAKKLSRGKASYGMVGIHRVETRANLTSG